MPNPRKFADRTDNYLPEQTYVIDGVTITYDGAQPNGAAATMIGKAVSLSADGTVQLAADADAVLGKLLRVEPDGMCVVRERGHVTLPGGNGATLTRGVAIVGALGAASARGYIRIAASATAAEIVKQRGTIVANTDTANVEVLL